MIFETSTSMPVLEIKPVADFPKTGSGLDYLESRKPDCLESVMLGMIRFGHDVSRGNDDIHQSSSWRSKYVDPLNGDNSNSGDFSLPWNDLNYAILQALPNDKIYLKDSSLHDYTVVIDSAPSGIEIRSFPGEWAIFDLTGIGEDFPWQVLNTNSLTLRNFEVRNSNSDNWLVGMSIEECNSFRVSNLYIHHIQGPGLRLVSSQDAIAEYCTFSDNYDPRRSGGNGDGIGMKRNSVESRNHRFYRCVAHHNSDDGFDTWDSTNCTFEECISYNNGFDNGDGNGFKLGNIGGNTCIRCISLFNVKNGYDENAGNTKSYLYNCASYNNQNRNYNIYNTPWDIYNSISIGAPSLLSSGPNIVTSLGEEFGGSVSIDDFESVDLANLALNSPGNRFFYPKSSSSHLLDAGTIVSGISFEGEAPDISPSEFGAVDVTNDPTFPSFGETTSCTDGFGGCPCVGGQFCANDYDCVSSDQPGDPNLCMPLSSEQNQQASSSSHQATLLSIFSSIVFSQCH